MGEGTGVGRAVEVGGVVSKITARTDRVRIGCWMEVNDREYAAYLIPFELLHIFY